MADIVFKYEEMEKAASEIAELADQYKNAAETFETNFLSSVSGWEGMSHDQLQNFISGPVKEYMGVTVPSALNSLAELLRANATQMQSADQQIADSIPTSLG